MHKSTTPTQPTTHCANEEATTPRCEIPCARCGEVTADRKPQTSNFASSPNFSQRAALLALASSTLALATMSAGEASSSSALRAIMDDLEDRALRIEGVKAKTLSTDLGQWLLESGTSVDKLGHEWDRNGDGDITKAEFRVNMRKLPIAAKIDVAEIDALFDSLDTDHGGELDMGELKAALKKLLAEAKAFNKGTRQGNAKSAEVRSVPRGS